MAEKDPIAVVLDFMERINSGNVDISLRGDDARSCFVDALGAKFVSRETMRTAWTLLLQNNSGLQSFA